ncbi:phage head-binding domain-containing protein [Xenorhabdus bovienii]|uniref:phage head-binding domain-containing protein n=1 Tax=Xenorhabdus bovienii TaxID=40576 RepID=UPI0023B336C4|nr:phage head-binding domain-containing protein [Xenorhabdus bovienii]
MSEIIPNVVVSMPSQLFTMARSFKACSNGRIYIGKIDTDPTIPENQIQVYMERENGDLVPAPQPIIINAAGYPVYAGQIAKFVTVQGHSMAIYDSYGGQQFYFPNILKYEPDQFKKEIEGDNGFEHIGGLGENYTRTFNTLNEAKSYVGITVGSIIKTKGYHQVGDDGNAEYRIVPINTHEPDNGIFVNLPASNVQAELIHNGVVDIAVYGINRKTDDAANAINSINKNQATIYINGEYVFKSPIRIDIVNGGIRSYRNGLLIADPDSFKEWDISINFYSSAEYNERPFKNWTVASDGISYDLSKKGVFQIANNEYQSSSEILISNGAIIGAKSIRFTSNAWRVLFDRVGIERCDGMPLELNNTVVNAGEIMEFRHCWIVDNIGDSILSIGQWRFYGTSLPAGSSKSSVIRINQDAQVSFDGGNIEFQPNHWFPAFDTRGVSSLNITNSSLTLPENGDGMKHGIITAHDKSKINLSNCSLPLYGRAFSMEENEPTRSIIGGSGGYISILIVIEDA